MHVMDSAFVCQVQDIAKRHGLDSVDPQVCQLLSRALDTHLGSMIRQVFAMTRQRTDSDRNRPGMVLTGNLRKKLHEINLRERDKQKVQEANAQELQQVWPRSCPQGLPNKKWKCLACVRGIPTLADHEAASPIQTLVAASLAWLVWEQ